MSRFGTPDEIQEALDAIDRRFPDDGNPFETLQVLQERLDRRNAEYDERDRLAQEKKDAIQAEVDETNRIGRASIEAWPYMIEQGDRGLSAAEAAEKWDIPPDKATEILDDLANEPLYRISTRNGRYYTARR